MRLHRRLIIETREFARLKHNKDLCPRYQLQLESILRALGRFAPVVYDTQGVFDQGADIVVRLRDERRLDHEPPELIGLQIKSYDDFRQGGVLKTLKAQRDDAFRKVHGMSRYYVVLCTDEEEHKDTIRNIEAEFKGADRTVVVEPSYALSFLKLSDRRIEGHVTRLAQTDDLVFKRALETVDLETPTAGLLALHLAALACEGLSETTAEELKNQSDLEAAYQSSLDSRRAASEVLQKEIDHDDDEQRGRARLAETFFDSFDDALAYDLEVLEASLADLSSGTGVISIRRTEMLPLLALLTDAKVRYELEGPELVAYGAEALGLVDE